MPPTTKQEIWDLFRHMSHSFTQAFSLLTLFSCPCCAPPTVIIVSCHCRISDGLFYCQSLLVCDRVKSLAISVWGPWSHVCELWAVLPILMCVFCSLNLLVHLNIVLETLKCKSTQYFTRKMANQKIRVTDTDYARSSIIIHSFVLNQKLTFGMLTLFLWLVKGKCHLSF